MQNIVINAIEDNTGSVAKFWFAPVQDIYEIPDAVDYLVAEPIVFNTYKNWYTGTLTQETPGFEEKENKSSGGSGVRLSFSGFLPGHAQDWTKMFTQMKYQRFVLIVQDFDGRKRLLGSLKNPMRFRFEFSTGSKTSTRKGYQIEFYQTAKDSPYFYESPFVAYPDDISDDADTITLDAYLAAVNSRLDIAEADIDALESGKLDNSGDISTGIIKYSADFSGSFDNRSLTDVEFVNNAVAGIISDITYGISWDASTLGVSQNAVYDLAQLLVFRDGSLDMTGNLNMGTHSITNLADLLLNDGGSVGLSSGLGYFGFGGDGTINVTTPGMVLGGDLDMDTNGISNTNQITINGGGIVTNDTSDAYIAFNGDGSMDFTALLGFLFNDDITIFDNGKFGNVSDSAYIQYIANQLNLRADDIISILAANEASLASDNGGQIVVNASQILLDTSGSLPIYLWGSDYSFYTSDGLYTGSFDFSLLDNDYTYQLPAKDIIVAGLDDVPEIPDPPAPDGIEYIIKTLDGVRSNEPIRDGTGVSVGTKNKLKAGASGDWVNGYYEGATSGAITETYGGQWFSGQDATDSLFYKYDCETDNNWIRTLLA